MMQLELPLIEYEIEREVVHQRLQDGYVDATAMCKAAGKLFADYQRSKQFKEFIKALSSDMGIPISGLVQIVRGGYSDMQGTWVHPQVAIHLAQWCSPKFAVQVSKWVFNWMSGKTPGGNLPYHLRRYMANMNKVPAGYFSILNEMTIALIAPLEQMGYQLPDNMVPDISEGRMFSKWLRDNGHDPDSMPQYWHTYEDGRKVQARAYPNTLLAEFRRHFIETWMTEKSIGYFTTRDTNALPHLKNLLALPNYRDVAGFIEDKTK